VALGRVLDEPVRRGVLVRCRTDGPAEQIELTGFDEAVAELERVVAVSGGGG
jgi:hypothetical protein